jgi:hypothetical protein
LRHAEDAPPVRLAVKNKQQQTTKGVPDVSILVATNIVSSM